MKKTLSFILALVMIATMFAVITVPASAADAGKVEGSVYDGTMDKTWYNAEDPKTEYTLYTAAELAGLADLVNTDGVGFKGVTIKLGADIIWNEGTFTLGKDGKTPVYNGALVPEDINVWPVIGTRPSGNNTAAISATNNFWGNFDGQGHVISGLYANNTGAYTGFISVFGGEYVKNLSIVNSFFGCDWRTGAFVGFARNDDANDVTLENLYTDAIIVLKASATNARSGGIMGMARKVNSVKMKNVWFDGSLNALGGTTEAPIDTPYMGGLVGFIVSDAAASLNEVIEFDSCLVTGSINANFKSGYDVTKRGVGGLMGSFHTGANKALTSPVKVNVKNCLVAVESTNLARTEETDMKSYSAFVARFETTYSEYTVENSYYVPNGVFSTSNTMSHVDANLEAEAKQGVTFNGTLIATKHTVPTEETVPTANIAKIADAQGLEAFDLTGKTAALKGIRTELVKNFSIWDGTVDTSWYDPANIQTEYTLTTAAQLAGLAEIVDKADAATKPFLGVTIKLGTNIVLNTGTFTLGKDNKTPVYNGALISAENPVNVWEPIGVSYGGNNECDVYAKASFWGAFDGQGYVISGMYVNNPTTQQQGLFGSFAGTSIKNVVITNSYVCGESRNGSLVGFISNNNKTNEDKAAKGEDAPACHDVIIENIYSDAIVVATHGASDVRSGGIVGISRRVKALTYKNLTFEGIISAKATTTAAARNWGGVIGVTVDDKAEGTVYENIVMKGAIYADTVHTDAQTGALIGNHCFGNVTMTGCVVDLKDTNMTLENKFAAEHVTDGVADLRGNITTYSALIGCYEKADTVATIENCSWTHKGVFVTGIGEIAAAGAMINGKGLDEWKAATLAEDIPGGQHAYTDVAAKEATCTEAGNVAYKVCDCGSKVDAEGKEIADVTVAAKGHTYGEWVAPVDPTETAAGVLGHYQCSVCKKYFDADKNEMTSIEGAPALGTTPGTDPGTTPGTDPGTTPGTDPEQPGTDPEQPGTNPEQPGTNPEQPGTDPEQPGTNPVVPETDPEQPGTTPEQPGTTPTTDAPTTEPAPQKGCGKKNGGFAAVVALVAIMGAAIVIKKK